MAKCTYLTASWKRCDKEAVPGSPYCQEHQKMVSAAMQSKNPAGSLRATELAAGAGQPGKPQTQRIEYVFPAQPKSIIVGVIFLIIGIFLLMFLLNAVKISGKTAWELIWTNIYPFIVPILAYGEVASFAIILGIGVMIIIALYRVRTGILGRLGSLFSGLNTLVWIPNGILIFLFIATLVSPYAPSQMYCFITSAGDLARCSEQQQQPPGPAEQGVFESPMRTEYGTYDFVNSRTIPLNNPTAGQKYYPTVSLRPNANYDSDINGVVINMAGVTVKNQTVNFVGTSCTPSNTCTISKNLPITNNFESSSAIPCDGKSMTLYSQINYPIDGARNGYKVRIVRSQEDLGMSLADDIGKASKIYGPVDFALGFAPSQHVVIPKSGTGKVIVYVYASNEYRGIATIKNVRLVQEPEKSGNKIYKLNLVGCDPVTPSVNEDKGNIYYNFGNQVQIKSSQTYQTEWDWGTASSSITKKEQITCTFEIPFSLQGTSDYYKTITFHVGGSYTYSEEVSSGLLGIYGTC